MYISYISYMYTADQLDILQSCNLLQDFENVLQEMF
jgi:hypothetical protein